MATTKEVLKGVAAAMEEAVPELTVALSREADPTDNDVRWPHGEIIIVSNNRSDQWNTDKVGYVLDDQGNRIGKLLDAKYDISLQLNVWISVPSQDWNIKDLGSKMERYFRRYDENRDNPETLPDGDGGKLTETDNFRITEGGTLPVEGQHSPPHRGYQVPVSFRYTSRINTVEEYGPEPYVESVDTPQSGDLVDSDETDGIEIEYVSN